MNTKLSSDYLFSMIKSLTRSEKRHVKLHLSQGTDARTMHYIRLFDLMNSQHAYNETVILKSWQVLYEQKSFAKAKYNLYNRILKSLSDLYRECFELRNLMSCIEILYYKKLYHQCNQQVAKVWQLASSHNVVTYAWEALQWKKKLFLHIPPKSPKEYDILRKKEEQINQSSQVEATLLKALGEMRFLRQAGFNLTTSLENKLNNPLLCQNLPTTRSKLIAYETKGIYYQMKGDFLRAFQSFETALNLWNTQLSSLFNESFIKCLMNFTLSAFICKKTVDYKRFIEKIEGSRNILTSNIFQQDLLIKIFCFMRAFKEKAIQQCERIIGEIVQFMKKSDANIEPFWMNILRYVIGLFYFSITRYKKALYWVNLVIENTQTNLFLTSQFFAKILKLLIHYNLGDLDLFDYLYNSAKRSLNKKQDKTMFETTLLKYIRKLYQVANKCDLKVLLNELECVLQRFRKTDTAQKNIEIDIIFVWIQTKKRANPLYVYQMMNAC